MEPITEYCCYVFQGNLPRKATYCYSAMASRLGCLMRR
jgi:hypothetical protein